MIGLIRDLFAFGGLALVGVGLWWYSPPAALVTVGAILMLLGIGGVRWWR